MLSFLLISSAFAVPLQFHHQGRLLDIDGKPVMGEHDLTFRIYDADINGNVQWEETLTVDFIDGFYAVELGEDEANNPLDTTMLSNYPLWIELTVDTDTMEPRFPMQSVPYARIAGVAESVEGGIVDADEIAIQSEVVIDSNKNWLGEPIPWNSIDGVPSDITDGDDNTQLSESDVENYITNDAINLAQGSTVDGHTILTVNDTLEPEWSNIVNVPSDLLDGDDNTQLSENDVETYITNGSIDLHVSTTIDGNDIIFTDLVSCLNGDVLIWDGILEHWYCEQTELQKISENCTANQVLKWDADNEMWGCQDDNDSNTQLQSSDVIAFVESNVIQSTATICDQNGCIGDSIWTLVGDDIFYETGNVGIGTNNPTSTLEVIGSISGTTISGTIVTSQQPNITEVGTISAGTWEANVIEDAFVADNLHVENGTIENTIIGSTSPQSASFTDLSASNGFSGSVLTSQQPNITEVGTLDSLQISGDVTVDTDTLYVDTTSQQVGIGTATPQNKLDVVGVISTSEGIQFSDGSVQTTAAVFGGYKSIWKFKAGTSHGDYSTSFVWGDWINERLAEGVISQGGLYECNMSSNNGAHYSGFSFTMAVNLSSSSNGYNQHHRIFDIHETDSGWVGGCGASLYNISGGVHNAGGFSYRNTCTQEIDCRCIQMN